MTRKITHASLYVKDQNEALRFYTEKLGFEVRADITNGDFRWLTVSSKDQPDFEVVLLPLRASDWSLSQDDVEVLTRLLEAGKLGGPVMRTDDIHKAYEEWKEKGVEFLSPPTDQPWGVDAVFKDNSGNIYSLQQRKK